MTNDERSEQMLEEGRERLVAQVRARLEAGERVEGDALATLFGREISYSELEVAASRGTSSANRGNEGIYSRLSVRGWVGYAAVAVITVIGIKQIPELIAPRIPSAAFRTYTTAPGQRANIALADGSRVTLGPATTIRVQQTSNSQTNVDITGEALFTVEQNAKKPFVVTAHGVTTRVLGTEFVVRAYKPSLVRIAVRDGRVSVQTPALTDANAAIVAAGEAASVLPNMVPTISPISDLATEFAWASGNLVLTDVPLGEALVRLSRWYGLELRVSDPSLFAAEVNGTFTSAFSQAEMRSLAKVIGARVIQSGTVITFTPVR